MLNIDDDENADWLHSKLVTFTVSKDGVELGTCNIEEQTIKTEDAELEDFYYFALGEGLDGHPIIDTGDFELAMGLRGYTVL